MVVNDAEFGHELQRGGRVRENWRRRCRNRRPGLRSRLYSPWLIAALLGLAYLIIAPPSADLAAQTYRTELFERHGFALWDNAWYGGHHLPGYSILFPPLAALLGARVVGVISAVAAAALFERLVAARYGRAGRLGALWFAAATATNLVSGRLTFALGVCFGVGAVLAATRDRRLIAVGLAALTALASPVAGLFLTMAAIAWWLSARTGAAIGLGAGAAVPIVGLMAAFPEGGTEPFVRSSFAPAFLLVLALLVALPPQERALRVGTAIYLAGIVASYVLDTPMGGNVTRLGTVFAGPVLACAALGASGEGRRRGVFALILLALPLLQFQWGPPVRDWRRAADDPSVHAGYYRELLAFLDSHPGPFRIEIPFTANHWEARHVAPQVALARGWERQLDLRHNAVFYEGTLTAARYRAWLLDSAVRYVALPDVKLDYSARAEARIIRDRPPFLHEVWRGRHWAVFAVRGARPLADGARMAALETAAFELEAARPVTATARVRFTPYWKITEGTGCVSGSPGGWTRVQIPTPGRVRVSARFAPGRVISDARRCTKP